MPKRTPEENEVRRLRRKLILDLTGDSKLADRGRDLSTKTFNKLYPNYKLPTEKQHKKTIKSASKYGREGIKEVNKLEVKKI